jgi:hypothetical protein
MVFMFLKKIGKFDEQTPLKPEDWNKFLELVLYFSDKEPLKNIKLDNLP